MLTVVTPSDITEIVILYNICKYGYENLLTSNLVGLLLVIQENVLIHREY